MVFSKTLLVLLLAILGTSWIPDGRTNGLASACSSRPSQPDRYEQKKDPKVAPTKVPTIDDIPLEDDKFAPLTVGIWVEDKFYRLPNARYYKVEIKNDTARSSIHVPNPFYRGGPIVIKD
ncbi:hypothetical protein G9C98_001786 [Cotesia typhae]|uniref:Uncharacterized protein n=2 Tax=Cotesia typhae TaxID=2053667 RepID=A0A8J5QSQ2_9HYME|nr:hypothetical protein G9C98_001786 [Cotesia typhae]